MKKKLLCQLMAITIVGTMISGEVAAAAPEAVTQQSGAENVKAEEQQSSEASAEDKNDTVQSDQKDTENKDNADETADGAGEQTPESQQPEEPDTDEDEKQQEPAGDTEDSSDEEGDSEAETENEKSPDAEGSMEDASDLKDAEITEEIVEPNGDTRAKAAAFSAEERAYTEYSGSYNYVKPNDSVKLSPSNVNASDVVDEALGIISLNEGTYTTVTKKDVKALSIGKLQWHGQNALAVLREIIMQDKDDGRRLLGDSLYKEAMNVNTNWNNRVLTDSEASKIKALLNTSQSIKVQDDIERSCIAVYVNSGIERGIRNASALVYYADLQNQGGSGGASRCAARAYNLVGSYSAITLNELHIASMTDSVLGYWDSGKMDFRSRRARVYGYASGLGWTYCQSKDSQIPYKTLSSSNQTGTKWLQWALNEYCGADLTVNGKYDTETIAAVKKFQEDSKQTADGLAGTNTIDAVMEKIMGAGRDYKPGSSSGTGGSDNTNTGDNNNGNTSYPVPTRTLKSGSQGNDVKWLQTALNKVLGKSLDVDGEYGSGTKTAVADFQKKTGLSSDGIFGTNSRNEMTAMLDVQSSKPSVSVSTSKGTNTVKWSKVGDATGYKVYRKTASGSWELLTTIKSLSTVSYTDKTAKEGTTYYYTAKAYRTTSSLTVNGQYVSNVKITTSKKSESSSSNQGTSYPVPTRTLKSGSQGNDVKWLQTALNTVLGTKISVDGTYGSDTKTAVADFQKKTGLSSDGIFGTNSRNKMTTLLNVQKSKPSVSVSTKNGQNTVKWSKVSNASGYRVYRKTASGSWELLTTIKSGSTVSYTDKTAKAGTTYYYTAKAYRTDSKLTVYGQYVSNVKITTSKTAGTSSSSGSSTWKNPYSAPTRLLNTGSRGNDVKWLQTSLNKICGTKLTVDGIYGSGTKNAVKTFQKKYKLSADGIFGSKSLAKMKTLVATASSASGSSGSSSSGSGSASSSTWKNPYSAPTRLLNTGSRGNDVKWLQTCLNKVCNSKLTVDGIYGSGTKNAVKTFQKKYKLSADGIFGSKSLAKMKSVIK
ncbi:N-acetylmuramoyl-L-alanine amidase CwlA precursor [uncultured Roseburia sp.]|uniref:Peptidoglycan-binding protein n=1 Tax=Brotonthovivens ammoniilytica TaxID=2981725 RepID=A0ABT2TMW5_9FIRM|nr:peptidoglycan-binding protein [Brotonthovivens ammoniilytica]MCU6763569.1 peptidoglycan-binding protein [Brotonthovivens ammoniilytica]SCJ25338.1 N-acetylmuramoyl-L-alanine amidase CwlA precursor [uncultured Roseburia sp.]